MKRAADQRIWAIVAATVRPLQGKTHPSLPLVGRERPRSGQGGAIGSPNEPALKKPVGFTELPHPGASRLSLPTRGREAPEHLEPHLHRRIVRGREPIAGTIDLHGLTHDAARAALTGFVLRAVADGRRAVLVITGKGALGDGVLRRHAPEWLGQPPLREHVAGISDAHRRHGGEGALYVALRRERKT